MLPSSCIGLDDGYYWLKLRDGNYPIVYQKCSNEYLVLDYSIDNNIKEYFNTWQMWHMHTAGPSNDVHIHWEDWYSPNQDTSVTGFLISPDCSVCDEDSSRQLYSTQSSYWMTGTIFGMYWIVSF